MNKTTVLKDKLEKMKKGFTFDDILLLPGYADFKRSEVDLKVVLHQKIQLKLPVISSPMDTVTEKEMAIALARAGGLGIIHRNLSIEEQQKQVLSVKQTLVDETDSHAATDNQGRLLVGAALGVGSDLEERAQALIEAGVDLLVLDSGHGYTKFIIEGVKQLKAKYPEAVVMAGNVATYSGAKALVEAGTDILRIGMGPGSICTTRIITGMGVPQLTAIVEAVEAVGQGKTTIVADGGIKQMGDMAKALAYGADAVMLGSLLAGFIESPGETLEINGKQYKSYRGMGSISAMKKGGAERYGQKKESKTKELIAEGVEGLLKFKGAVADYLFQIEGSLRASFYYIGARTVAEFFKKSQLIKISTAGLIESHPHDVLVADGGNNYHQKNS